MDKKKKKFRVLATITSYLYLDVEAYDKDDAYDIAVDTDGGDFIEEDAFNGGWDVNGDTIEEVE